MRSKVNKAIGQFLQNQRKKAGITQTAVSTQMGLTTAQYVSNVERGISPASVELLKVCVELYGLDVEHLAHRLSRLEYDYYLAEFSKPVPKPRKKKAQRKTRQA